MQLLLELQCKFVWYSKSLSCFAYFSGIHRELIRIKSKTFSKNVKVFIKVPFFHSDVRIDYLASEKQQTRPPPTKAGLILTNGYPDPMEQNIPVNRFECGKRLIIHHFLVSIALNRRKPFRRIHTHICKIGDEKYKTYFQFVLYT